MFSPDQFTHILPPSIWCITTPRYYFWGTTFIISNLKCYGKNSAKGTSELRSTRPNFIPFLATRCLYGRVCLTAGHSDPKAHQIARWPDIVLLLATRCLQWGYIWAQVSLTQRLTTCHADLMSYCSWSLDTSKGGTSDCRSAWPKGWPNVKLFSTASTGGRGASDLRVSLTQRLTICKADLM